MRLLHIAAKASPAALRPAPEHTRVTDDIKPVWGMLLPDLSMSSVLQAGMRWLESAYPDKARGWVGFNVPMSHKITAACDLLLMPSRFEPCGLNQLYAMRYGTVPVAHATGGLRDTVLPFNPWEGQ